MRHSIIDRNNFKHVIDSIPRLIESPTLWTDYFRTRFEKLCEKNAMKTTKLIYDSIVLHHDFSITEENQAKFVENQRVIRRLVFWLKKTNLCINSDGKSLYTESLLTRNFDVPAVRDVLLNIAKMSPEFCLTDTFDH